jgi:hypothetical protein
MLVENLYPGVAAFWYKAECLFFGTVFFKLFKED